MEQVIFDKDGTKYLCVKREEVQEYKAYIDSTINGDFSSEFSKGYCYGQKTALDSLFGDKCLPDKEESVQSEPKFKVGDKVRFEYSKDSYSRVQEINDVRIVDGIFEYQIGSVWAKEPYIIPYTEPSNVSDNDTKDDTKDNDNREALYNALFELESASRKVREALISLQ